MGKHPEAPTRVAGKEIDTAPTDNGAVHRLQITFASTPAALGNPLQQRC